MSTTSSIDRVTMHYSGGECSDLPPQLSPAHRVCGRKKKSPRLSVDVQEEIKELFENVPELNDHFDILNKIGEGTFSSVYVARLKSQSVTDQLFALKHVIPTSSPARTENELRCLREAGGVDHVMAVLACIRRRDHVVIIMPYFEHLHFQDYIQDVSMNELRDYMYALLTSLKRVHSINIIHRDVKPSNFLYDRKNKRYALVDFGLAQVLSSDSNVNKHEGSSKQENSRLKNNSEASQAETNGRLSITENSTSRNKMNSAEETNQTTSSSGKKPNPSFSVDSQTAVNDSLPNRVKPVYTSQMLHHKRNLLVKNSTKNMYKIASQPICKCYGQALICNVCLSRVSQSASRAGTPGFRSPEVLIKYPDQTTAVDVWSAGVIFLSLLSGRYPFFKANDDMTALAQIVAIFGSDAMKSAAKKLGKNLLMNPSISAIDLRTLCTKLRKSGTDSDKTCITATRCVNRDFKLRESMDSVPDSTYDLLSKLLTLNPLERISAAEALDHVFFME